MRTLLKIVKYLSLATFASLFMYGIASGQVSSPNFWNLISGTLKPNNNSYNLQAPANFRFDGEIQPDGSTCSDGEILKKTGANNWDCAADNNSPSATTTINSLSGPAFTFASGTPVTGLDFFITGSGSTITFKNVLQSGYNIPLTASTTNWNTAFGWGNHAGLYPTFAYASSSYVTLWNLNAGSNIQISTSSGVTISSTDQYTGTVTSVNMTVPTGLSISGNPITTSGTLALSLTSGYVIPLTASTTEWALALQTKLSTTTAAATYEPILTKGNLTANSPLSFNNTRQVIGGAAALSLDTSGTWTGNAGTATVLAANGSNCSAGQAAGGVSASGAAEDCTDYWTESENTSADYLQSADLVNYVLHSYASSTFVTYNYASTSYATLWNLKAGTNITISTSSGVTINGAATPTIIAGGTATGPAFTITTTTPDTNVGVTFTASGSTINASTTWTGTLADARIASAATWNAKQAGDATLTALAGLTVAQGDLIYGTGADAFSMLSKDTNATRYLSNTGSSNNPAWAQVALGTGVSGVLPVANGGTGTSTAPTTQGQILAVDSTGAKYLPTHLVAGSNITITTTTPGQITLAASLSGSGIASLNGLTADTQTFAVATSGGISLLVSSNTATHTFTAAPHTGYTIPLTASTTEWSTAFGWGNHAGNYPTFAYASSSYVTLWNLTAGSNITVTTSSVPTIAVSATPTFTTLSTGQGQYELYAMNQNVQTADAVQFATSTLTGAIIMGGDTIQDFVGTGLSLSGTTLQAALGTSVSPTEMASTDFGDFSCNGTVCTLDATYLTSAITSLNGLTGASQTFATTTGGSLWSITSSGTAHTWNIPATPTFTGITVTNASTTNLTVATDSFLGTVRSGTWNGTAVDIGSYTNLAAGRSLTLSGDSVEADSELFTRTKAFSFRAGSGVISATTSIAQLFLPTNSTITLVYCSTNANGATIQLDERATSTPNTAGTDVMTTALNCTSSGAQTTSFSNAGILAEVPINFDLDDASTTVTRISGFIKYTSDD